MYIGKERYCHSSVVARISMYGERIRYIIKTELRQQRDFKCIETVGTLLPQHCGNKDLYV